MMTFPEHVLNITDDNRFSLNKVHVSPHSRHFNAKLVRKTVVEVQDNVER